MEEVNEAIHLLHNSQARHKRKGFKYGDNTPDEMLRHAAEELVELVTAEAVTHDEEGDYIYRKDDIAEELSDLLLILFHYAYIHGLHTDNLQIRMLDKMKQRFTLKPKELTALMRLKGKIVSRNAPFQRATNKRDAKRLKLYGDE